MRANAESFKSWLLADLGQLELPGLYQKKGRASMPYEMRALDVNFEVGQFVSLAIQNHAILESLARSSFRAPKSAR